MAVAGCGDAAGDVCSGVGVGVVAGGGAAVSVRVLVGVNGRVLVLLGAGGMYNVGVRDGVLVNVGVLESGMVSDTVGEISCEAVLLALCVACGDGVSVVGFSS